MKKQDLDNLLLNKPSSLTLKAWLPFSHKSECIHIMQNAGGGGGGGCSIAISMDYICIPWQCAELCFDTNSIFCRNSKCTDLYKMERSQKVLESTCQQKRGDRTHRRRE